jgi:hypothetical protein
MDPKSMVMVPEEFFVGSSPAVIIVSYLVVYLEVNIAGVSREPFYWTLSSVSTLCMLHVVRWPVFY